MLLFEPNRLRCEWFFECQWWQRWAVGHCSSWIDGCEFTLPPILEGIRIVSGTRIVEIEFFYWCLYSGTGSTVGELPYCCAIWYRDAWNFSECRLLHIFQLEFRALCGGNLKVRWCHVQLHHLSSGNVIGCQGRKVICDPLGRGENLLPPARACLKTNLASGLFSSQSECRKRGATIGQPLNHYRSRSGDWFPGASRHHWNRNDKK